MNDRHKTCWHKQNWIVYDDQNGIITLDSLQQSEYEVYDEQIPAVKYLRKREEQHVKI